jgi:hypothetical protein
MLFDRTARALARSFKQVVTAGVLSLVCASGAQAALIAGAANDTTGVGFGVGFSFAPDVNLVIAQGFDVTAPTSIGSVTVYLNDDDPSNNPPLESFTLYITRAIGAAATAADVLATLTGSIPLTPPGAGAHFAVTFPGLSIPVVPVAATLNDYFLVIASAGGPGTGWGANGTPLAGVGNAFIGIVGGGGVGDYTTPDPNSPSTGVITHMNFLVETAAVSGTVPEPGSLALLGIAIGVFGLARRRRV